MGLNFLARCWDYWPRLCQFRTRASPSLQNSLIFSASQKARRRSTFRKNLSRWIGRVAKKAVERFIRGVVRGGYVSLQKLRVDFFERGIFSFKMLKSVLESTGG